MTTPRKEAKTPKKSPTWRDHAVSAGKVIGSAILREYSRKQQTIDTLVLTASAATITATVVDDYTNIGLLGGALVGAVGAGTLKGVQTLATQYLPSKEGEQ